MYQIKNILGIAIISFGSGIAIYGSKHLVHWKWIGIGVMTIGLIVLIVNNSKDFINKDRNK